MDTHNFIEKSLELHLFFGRIMKEHSLFLRAGFTPANNSFSNLPTALQRTIPHCSKAAMIPTAKH